MHLLCTFCLSCKILSVPSQLFTVERTLKKSIYKYRQVSNIRHTLIGNKICRSLSSSWSIACQRCSNYIFILNLTPGFIGLGKDNCNTRGEPFKFGDFVRLKLEILWYVIHNSLSPGDISRLHRLRWILLDMLVSCLMAPSHYLNQLYHTHGLLVFLKHISLKVW